MATTALLFEQGAPASSSLVFGDDVQVLLPAGVSITAAFPALSAQITLVPSANITLTGAFPPLQAVAGVTYSSNTQRPSVAQLSAAVQSAHVLVSGVSQPQQHASATNTATQGTFSTAALYNAGNTTGFSSAASKPAAITAAFAQGVPERSASITARLQEGAPQGLRFYSQFQQADRASLGIYGKFQDGIRTRTTPLKQRFQEGARRCARAYTGRAGAARATPARWGAKFQQGQVPPPGLYLPVDPDLPAVFWWGTELLFQCPALLYPALVFGARQCYPDVPTLAPLQILPARFYMTSHTIYAQRLPDLADVPIFEATVAADSGSYCWSLSASGPAGLFEQLAPVGGLPAQIKITLDGIPWVFAVDSMARTHAFGQTGVRIQGRSVTALISAPYLRATTRGNATDQTAQQIALEALTGTGVALDWGMGAGTLANGGLVDWLIPAGAWSHQSTPLDAVQDVVQAAGGYLQSHRSSATLQARHPYGQRSGDVSGAPWNWSLGAADVELATDALITESVQRQDGPDINAVYVSGTVAGVLALVKRSGTAADKLAQMLTDPLITHADAARQRGLSVLGAAGHKYAVTLELPVLTGTNQPGVLDVGQLVQVNASQPWRARVRSVSVQAKQPTLRQTITLERHLEAI